MHSFRLLAALLLFRLFLLLLMMLLQFSFVGATCVDGDGDIMLFSYMHQKSNTWTSESRAVVLL